MSEYWKLPKSSPDADISELLKRLGYNFSEGNPSKIIKEGFLLGTYDSDKKLISLSTADPTRNLKGLACLVDLVEVVSVNDNIKTSISDENLQRIIQVRDAVKVLIEKEDKKK